METFKEAEINGKITLILGGKVLVVGSDEPHPRLPLSHTCHFPPLPCVPLSASIPNSLVSRPPTLPQCHRVFQASTFRLRFSAQEYALILLHVALRLCR